MTTPADRIERILPAAACGEDVVIDFTGPTDPSGYTLSVSFGFNPYGPRETLLGVSVTKPGGTVIRVTVPSAVTSLFVVPPGEDRGTIYGEIWRENAGDFRPLRRFSLAYYQPVRPAL